MVLSETLIQIRNARGAHKAWVAKAEALVAGIPLEKDQVPLLPTDCIFGKWYYGEGHVLRKLPAYKKLEKPHDKLHKTYMQIFKLLFDEPDTGALGRLFGKAKKLKAEQVHQAKELLPTLIELSDTVCDTLEELEEQLETAAKKQRSQKNVATPILKAVDNSIEKDMENLIKGS